MGPTLCLVSSIWLHAPMLSPSLSLSLSLSHLFFFPIFKHIWIKPNFLKESIVYQNQTYSRANYSNLKQNPAQKHKFGPGNSLIKLQNLENL